MGRNDKFRRLLCWIPAIASLKIRELELLNKYDAVIAAINDFLLGRSIFHRWKSRAYLEGKPVAHSRQICGRAIAAVHNCYNHHNSIYTTLGGRTVAVGELTNPFNEEDTNEFCSCQFGTRNEQRSIGLQLVSCCFVSFRSLT